jgi:Rhs element Vgr protein
MPDSPTLNSSGVLKLSVFANGSPIDDSIQLVSVSINKTINRIPRATIVLLDGDMPEQDFPVSNSDDFKPGSEIKINAGYDQSEETLFEGIVIKHGIKITGDNYSRLVIECRDKAVAMTIGRKNANFIDMKDSDIISKLIADSSGLSPDVQATAIQHKELVQYYCSDWDFMLSRAEINGLLVCVDDGKVAVRKPQTDASAELKVSYGDDLIEFHADMDARTQYAQVSSVSWDPAAQNIIEEQISPQILNAQGNLQSSALAKVINLPSFDLQTPTKLEKGALKEWAKAQQVKAGLARIRGRMKFQGNAKAKPNTLIKLEGVGNRFNGDVFVSAVNHELVNGNWITQVEFGMSPDWFAEQRDLVAPPASGLLPGIEGLQIGVVLKLDEDPEGQSRVQVKVPVLQAGSEGVWARLANYYASDKIGAFFIPEIGDEVVLGYLNNDPSNPVILGSLYSNKRAAPYALTKDNFIKALVTREQLKIEFDDEKKIITVITPNKNTVVLDDDGKSILMQDQNGNEVELSADGIVLDSPKDISITAKGKITIEATDKIAVSSQADVAVDGMNVNHTAKTSFVAKGNASAELSASGQTTIKGAMVMIN